MRAFVVMDGGGGRIRSVFGDGGGGAIENARGGGGRYEIGRTLGAACCAAVVQHRADGDQLSVTKFVVAVVRADCRVIMAHVSCYGAVRCVGDKHPREECSVDDVLNVCGARADGRSAMKPKRLKQMQYECATNGDDDDLLRFLDVGREYERRVYGKVDAVRISPALRHLPEYNALDMRTVAPKAMTSAKRSFALRDRVADQAVINEHIDIVSDGDDLLKHLDVASEKENAGRSDTHDEDIDNDCSDSIAVIGHRNTHEDLNIPRIARAVLAV
ncbi:hypothetical protein PHYPSEUDO_002774 [Phytophthora pseudosyringae]|uniref:Uncharacterized protein n=1 Tax=Phytophthora pseudosyringae TaxID=221518 RepID=A0A8T1VWB6_9STRA|nr:hypothetical protein PHYPSEUDO_002774 [Phytophthora pseudosyringae]